MDETYVKVGGQWNYLYRAVDKAGNTADFLLRAHRDKAAARRYFEKAIDRNGTPETVTMDKSGANLAALQAINAERETPIKVRQVKYLNNIVEQDHRAITFIWPVLIICIVSMPDRMMRAHRKPLKPIMGLVRRLGQRRPPNRRRSVLFVAGRPVWRDRCREYRFP